MRHGTRKRGRSFGHHLFSCSSTFHLVGLLTPSFIYIFINIFSFSGWDTTKRPRTEWRARSERGENASGLLRGSRLEKIGHQQINGLAGRRGGGRCGGLGCDGSGLDQAVYEHEVEAEKKMRRNCGLKGDIYDGLIFRLRTRPDWANGNQLVKWHVIDDGVVFSLGPKRRTWCSPLITFFLVSHFGVCTQVKYDEQSARGPNESGKWRNQNNQLSGRGRGQSRRFVVVTNNRWSGNRPEKRSVSSIGLGFVLLASTG